MHDKVRVTKDQPCKPDVLVMQDNIKDAIDGKDLVSLNCSTRIKLRRWLISGLAFQCKNYSCRILRSNEAFKLQF